MALSSRFEEALAYAARLHACQCRKGGSIPYVSHLLAVASLAIEHGADEDEAIAALLHDALEDQPRDGKTRREIRERFGERVLSIVEGCTDAEDSPKPGWRERKARFIAQIGAADASVRLVAASDKLHNVRSILVDYRRHGESVWSRFTRGKDGTLWYYHEVAKALRSAGANPLVEELERTVEELDSQVSQAPASR
ncbi:MAG: HD domain-containing protein [Bryobacteraceae bacterium]